jgi:chemotaxis protein CheD
MGELRIGRGEKPLRTLLGSCIGLALYSPRSKVGGLAHIVLSYSRGQQGPPAKYADTAIPEMIRRIELAGGRSNSLKAKVAGGANMLGSQAISTIGDQNLETIQRLLREFEIPIVAEHCGGEQGRRMTFYPDTGRVTIEVVGGDRVDI